MKLRWVFLAMVLMVAIFGFLKHQVDAGIANRFDLITSPMWLGWLLAALTLRFYAFCDWMGWVRFTEIPRTSEDVTMTVPTSALSDRVHIRREPQLFADALAISPDLWQQAYGAARGMSGLEAQQQVTWMQRMMQDEAERRNRDLDWRFGQLGAMHSFEVRQTARRADDILKDAIIREQKSLKEVTDTGRLHKARIARFSRCMKGQTTVAEIHAEQNAELRQAMLEKFGLERYLNEVGAKVIAKDEYGELLEYADVERRDVTDLANNLRNLQISGSLSRDMLRILTLMRGEIIAEDSSTATLWVETVRRRVRAVRVLNSTPDWPAERRLKIFKPSVSLIPALATPDDPDLMACKHRDGYVRTGEKTAICNGCGAPGEFRTYILRVPPNLNTPRAAIAWTFGLRPEEYNPAVMT